MPDASSSLAIAMILLPGGVFLALSFWLAGRARRARGFFVADGKIPWVVNGFALAGDFLSAALFLGICGLIAFYGYDGFLYCLAFIAGWVVALFLLAEPIQRLGRITFAEALDAPFNSRGIRLAAGISTLIVSLLFVIPEMVGAGSLVMPLLGTRALGIGMLPDARYVEGVLLVGAIVIAIVASAGMVSATWVQFIKGVLLLLVCGVFTWMVLARGFTVKEAGMFPRILSNTEFARDVAPLGTPIPTPPGSPWITGRHLFYRLQMKDGSISTWIVEGQTRNPPALLWPSMFIECQTLTERADGQVLINGKPESTGNDLRPDNFVARLPLEVKPGQPLGPRSYLTTLRGSEVAVPGVETITDELDGKAQKTTVYFPRMRSGSEMLSPGPDLLPLNQSGSGTTKGRLSFLSLMLALVGGTASLPHLLIRYFTVKDQAAARKSTVLAIAVIGLIYLLTLYLGLGAMTTGELVPSDIFAAAPLLARKFGSAMFAVLSAVVVVTLLGTLCGLLVTAAGTVAYDLLPAILQKELDDPARVRVGRMAAIVVGMVAIALGILFGRTNVWFLIGWAFNIAASAILPAMTMLVFWKRATQQGIIASIVVGLVSSVIWVLFSGAAFCQLYGLAAATSPLPFDSPALVTIPLAYLTLILVSLLTPAAAPRGIRASTA